MTIAKENVKMTGPAMVLNVADLPKAVEFYERVLGFEREEAGGHVHMSRGTAVFILHPVPNPSDVRPNSSAEGGLYFDAYCYTDDVRSLFEELKGRGADIVRGVDPLDWNEQWIEFTIKDLNGYCITFGG
ncbi:VOC family protein [Paenibacillus contaminans]|uniref:Bleomycin resistance protein n=1 Tax=Paenibacillus contaminans TaxID=450362 RepID=A0A329MJC5_9BACL|nr:VOC family protein [Paenibacillus contaminans]RAV17757.1 bleomycin resistance protein [Paenibacillus contaminans]